MDRIEVTERGRLVRQHRAASNPPDLTEPGEGLVVQATRVDDLSALSDLTRSKIAFGPGCWIWTALKNKCGYGKVYVGGPAHYALAHRRVYEVLVGPIPDGLTLDHLCRVRCCVNPDHLEPVTHRENMLRGDTFAARYASRTLCGKGHPLSGDNLHVRRDGRRQCVQCRRDCEADRRARRRVELDRAAEAHPHPTRTTTTPEASR